MALKVSDIRYLIEEEIKDSVENRDAVNWCNQANADIGTSINIPATATVALNTTDLEYPEPAGLKVINRLRLQSDIDRGDDHEFTWPYRRYNGELILVRPFYKADTLHVDFYRQLTYFTDVSQPIDLEDRHAPLYTSYGLMKYYKLPAVMQRLGEAQARQEAQVAQGMYLNMKQQVTSLYALQNEPAAVDERW